MERMGGSWERRKRRRGRGSRIRNSWRWQWPGGTGTRMGLVVAVLVMVVVAGRAGAAPAKRTEGREAEAEERQNRHFVQSMRVKALHNLQRSLESLSSLTANSLMLNAALLQSDQMEEEEAEDADHPPESRENSLFDDAQLTPTTPSSARSKGVRRMRADIKKMPSDNESEAAKEMDTKAPSPISSNPLDERTRTGRHWRSAAGGRHHGHHRAGHQHGGQHRRRRKGCPTVQGKDQLLCPTRNSQRYDVCITRDQLCDRQRDCPGAEDEDPRHCFFYRPLENSLKTISHAVLLLVDTVMREQEQHNEL